MIQISIFLFSKVIILIFLKVLNIVNYIINKYIIFLLYKYSKHVSCTMSELHIYTAKYSILSIFRAKQKMTLRPSRKQCSLLCVFVMKEYLLNCSSIKSKYILLVFSSRFLLPKLSVSDGLAQGPSINYVITGEGRRSRPI